MVVDHPDFICIRDFEKLAPGARVGLSRIGGSAGLLLECDWAPVSVCNEEPESLLGLFSQRGYYVGDVFRAFDLVNSRPESAYLRRSDALGNFTTLLRGSGRFGLGLEE